MAAGKGAACNIICTQPRRISAVGLALRVSAERGENVGQTIGYTVRLDSKRSAQTRLTFCTTGKPVGEVSPALHIKVRILHCNGEGLLHAMIARAAACGV